MFYFARPTPHDACLTPVMIFLSRLRRQIILYLLILRRAFLSQAPLTPALTLFFPSLLPVTRQVLLRNFLTFPEHPVASLTALPVTAVIPRSLSLYPEYSRSIAAENL